MSIYYRNRGFQHISINFVLTPLSDIYTYGYIFIHFFSLIFFIIIATLPQELNTESPPGGLYPAPVQGMQIKWIILGCETLDGCEWTIIFISESRAIHLGIEEQGEVNGRSGLTYKQCSDFIFTPFMFVLHASFIWRQSLWMMLWYEGPKLFLMMHV